MQQWLVVPLSVILIALPLFLLYHSGDAGFRVVSFLFTGKAFSNQAIVAGGALDQASLQKEAFIFCYSLLLSCPFIALALWFNRSNTRLVKTIFVALSLIILLHPLSALTVFTWDVSRYMYHMGITTIRLLGLAGALVAYCFIAAIIVRIGGFSGQRPNKFLDDISPTSFPNSEST